MYDCISLSAWMYVYQTRNICLFNFKSKRRKKLHVNKYKNIANDKFIVIITLFYVYTNLYST